MKMGFSTLGCPAWPYEIILKRASEYGFNGFEVRGILGEMDLLKVPEFKPNQSAETLRKASDAGVEITMLMTSCKFSSPDSAERKKNLDEGKANMDLAVAMDVNMIRVFGGKIGVESSPESVYSWVVENLRNLAEYGENIGVVPAIEIHDDFVDTHLVKKIIRRIDHPNMKVLWDTHHPWRKFGQRPDECWSNIGKDVVDVHFKDSFVTDKERLGYKYCFFGEGDMPNQEALKVLVKSNYKGYLTLEWEKSWHDYLPEPEIGFPQYIEKMKEYLAELI